MKRSGLLEGVCYYCCPSCRGLYNSTVLLKLHVPGCKGHPRLANCQYFACDKGNYIQVYQTLNNKTKKVESKSKTKKCDTIPKKGGALQSYEKKGGALQSYEKIGKTREKKSDLPSEINLEENDEVSSKCHRIRSENGNRGEKLQKEECLYQPAVKRKRLHGKVHTDTIHQGDITTTDTHNEDTCPMKKRKLHAETSVEKNTNDTSNLQSDIKQASKQVNNEETELDEPGWKSTKRNAVKNKKSKSNPKSRTGQLPSENISSMKSMRVLLENCIKSVVENSNESVTPETDTVEGNNTADDQPKVRSRRKTKQVRRLQETDDVQDTQSTKNNDEDTKTSHDDDVDVSYQDDSDLDPDWSDDKHLGVTCDVTINENEQSINIETDGSGITTPDVAEISGEVDMQKKSKKSENKEKAVEEHPYHLLSNVKCTKRRTFELESLRKLLPQQQAKILGAEYMEDGGLTFFICKTCFYGAKLDEMVTHSAEHRGTTVTVKKKRSKGRQSKKKTVEELKTMTDAVQAQMTKSEIIMKDGVKMFKCLWCAYEVESVGSMHNHSLSMHFNESELPEDLKDLSLREQVDKMQAEYKFAGGIKEFYFACKNCAFECKSIKQMYDHSVNRKPGGVCLYRQINPVCSRRLPYNLQGCSLEEQGSVMQADIEISEDGKNIFKCKVCSYSTERRGLMNRHSKTHKPLGEVFKCESCDKTFITHRKLKRHMLDHNRKERGQLARNVQKFQCDSCGHIAKGMYHLTEHLRKHTGEYLKCPLDNCNFQTTYKRVLDSHMKKHEGNEHLCTICGYQTSDVGTYNKHVKRHTGMKDYVCSHPDCGFRGFSRQQVVVHIRQKHLKEELYKCDECAYSTATDSSMRVHIMTHRKILPFKCSECDFKSISSTKVKRHIRCHHDSAIVIKLPVEKSVSVSHLKVKQGSKVTVLRDTGEQGLVIAPDFRSRFDVPLKKRSTSHVTQQVLALVNSRNEEDDIAVSGLQQLATPNDMHIEVESHFGSRHCEDNQTVFVSNIGVDERFYPETESAVMVDGIVDNVITGPHPVAIENATNLDDQAVAFVTDSSGEVKEVNIYYITQETTQ